MNLDTLTPEQRDCVTHVQGPLLVSAGAGSGKTFMLTQRIAYALLNPDESRVDDIDQILAITFTELAASEIKARVRNRLREEGLAEQALKVDASWISTIHGMCSRILHECALELGLDPQFGLLDETDRDRLLIDCVNEALAEAGAVGDDEEGAAFSNYQHLFEEYEKADGESNVAKMVLELINTASNVRGGLDAVVTAEPESPHELAREAYDAMATLEAVASTGVSTTGKQKEQFTQRAFDVVKNADTGMPAFEFLMQRRECTYADVAEALARIDLDFGSRTRTEPFATGYAIFRQSIIRLAKTCLLGLVLPARSELLAVARRVQELFSNAKAEHGVLDQDDLLHKTLEAFETQPSIASRYADHFKLVMVDEFQDTSALQIALISHLTANNRHLCTVGDTQQSIYRFRGADVDTYCAHKQEMRSLEPQGGMYRELGKNFRSHGDIIAFVNRLFGAPQVFGKSGEFIELGWENDHDARNPFPDVPRIDVVATTSMRGSGANTDVRHFVEAEAIARRFETLHADAPNQRWGDMVILLGTMGRAEVYARTLRSHGIPCIVTGGSGFAATPEAREINSLLAAIADPWDSANLRSALTGSAFGLGADELYLLGHAPDGERRPLWNGLLVSHATSSSPRIRLAGSLLTAAVADADSRGASASMLELVIASGWLDRLQSNGPEGMASAANVLKTIRLIESIESDPTAPRGIPATAARLSHKLEGGSLKEKPGALMAEQQDAVRILTIHSSKGLEFPIVALADFYNERASKGSLFLETMGDKIYLTLKPSASTADGTSFDKLSDLGLSPKMIERLAAAGSLITPCQNLEEAENALEFDEAIRNRAISEEIAELRRKFYVGATRPREALVIVVNMDNVTASSTILDDLRQALFGEYEDYKTAPEGIEFGGERRAVTERMRLEFGDSGDLLINGEPATDYLTPTMAAELGSNNDEGGSEDEATAPAMMDVPEPPRDGEHLSDLIPGKRPCDPLRAGSFSYSRLTHGTQAQEATDPDEVRAEQRTENGASDATESQPAPNGGVNASAVAFGSALHQACQVMVENLTAKRTDGVGDAKLEIPPDKRLAAFLKTWGAPVEKLPALKDAMGRWANSKVACDALAYPHLLAEAPFCITLQGPQGEPLHLEGSIDLLCCDQAEPLAEQTAFVVDYKTGGSRQETPEQLQVKHRLQAMCYAYAALSGGYGAVELRFVRVQQRDEQDPSQPQVVAYRYEQAQRQELEETIREAYGAKEA